MHIHFITGCEIYGLRSMVDVTVSNRSTNAMSQRWCSRSHLHLAVVLCVANQIDFVAPIRPFAGSARMSMRPFQFVKGSQCCSECVIHPSEHYPLVQRVKRDECAGRRDWVDMRMVSALSLAIVSI